MNNWLAVCYGNCRMQAEKMNKAANYSTLENAHHLCLTFFFWHKHISSSNWWFHLSTINIIIVVISSMSWQGFTITRVIILIIRILQKRIISNYYYYYYYNIVTSWWTSSYLHTIAHSQWTASRFVVFNPCWLLLLLLLFHWRAVSTQYSVWLKLVDCSLRWVNQLTWADICQRNVHYIHQLIDKHVSLKSTKTMTKSNQFPQLQANFYYRKYPVISTAELSWPVKCRTCSETDFCKTTINNIWETLVNTTVKNLWTRRLVFLLLTLNIQLHQQLQTFTGILQ